MTYTVMENLIQCYTRWALLFLLMDEINTAQLTITPQEITVGGQNPTLYLNGTCTPNAPGITTLYNIEIGRRSIWGDRAIVQIETGGTSPSIKDPSLQSRLTVSGSINGASGSLQFSLRDPTCFDVYSTFYCKATYNTAGGIGSDETTRNITALNTAYPGTIKMILSPDRVQYDPPVLVQFTCTGLIGNTFPSNQSNFWQWQWRSVGYITTQWTTYPYSANITYQTPTPSGSCNYNGGSTLTHTVTDLDNGRQFRCSVVNDQYSDNKTVYTQTSTGVNTAKLTIIPRQITVGGHNPTPYLNGTCTLNAPGIVTLYKMGIGRRSVGGDTAIVQIQTGDNSPTIQERSLQSRLTVSGSINGASGSLQFSLRDPTCSDVDSAFCCKISYNTANEAGNDETTRNITALCVTPTLPPECLTNMEKIEYPRYDFGTTLGFGTAIGIGSMLVVIIIILIFVFIFRVEVAACLTGGRNKRGKVPDSGMRFQDISGGNSQTS